MLILAYLYTRIQENLWGFAEKEICTNSLSVLWPKTSSSNSHKATKNPNSSVKENQYKHNNISRRHAAHESKIFRTYSGSGNIDFSIAKIWVL